jgi:ribitol 2-dehydrogenase
LDISSGSTLTDNQQEEGSRCACKTGRIDLLHCNAGTYIRGDLLRPTATIDRMLNLNINAVIKNVHAVLPHMMEQGSGDSAVTCSLAGHSAIKHDL